MVACELLQRGRAFIPHGAREGDSEVREFEGRFGGSRGGFEGTRDPTKPSRRSQPAAWGEHAERSAKRLECARDSTGCIAPRKTAR